MPTELDAAIDLSADSSLLLCKGSWTMSGVVLLQSKINTFVNKAVEAATLDVSAIKAMDSAGALLLQELINQCNELGKPIHLVGVSDQYRTLLDLVAKESAQIRHSKPSVKSPNQLHAIGKLTYEKWMMGVNFMAFVGEVVVAFLHSVMSPRRIQWRLMLRNIDEAGFRALSIVGLLIFLVGLVLTYQIAIELSSFNANIYIVDVTGMVMLREFAPLITAVILAGRTCTSYSAQIGTMKINEEIDALNTMGVPSIERLVMPKVIALLIVMPLLTVWADIFGVLGSIVMSKAELGVSYYTYLDRFQHSIEVRERSSNCVTRFS